MTQLKQCTRSHPHENMDEICELRTEIARLTNQLAQPKQLTIEQLREHWQVAKVFDMTYAEIDFADYLLIVRDVETLYGIGKESNT